MNEKNVMEAFRIYSKLNTYGQVLKADAKYFFDEDVRGLVMEFANEVDCTIITAGEVIYLIPLTVNSEYHMSNAELKKEYLPSRATNIDLYLMYLTVIIFIGEFYDSYQTIEATRDFLTVDEWMKNVDERIQALKQIDKETFLEMEKEYEYNWMGMIEHWDSIDIIKETVKKQTARTNSRKSFMNSAKNFLIAQGLAEEIGNEELKITEKSKIIVQRFFMDYEYNRGILEVLYEFSGYGTYEENQEESKEV